MCQDYQDPRCQDFQERLHSCLKRSEQNGYLIASFLCFAVSSLEGALYGFLLSKDYEGLPKSSQALIYAAMIRIMIKRMVNIKN